MRRRILLYSRVNPADGGGVQRMFQGLADHLRGHGHAVLQAWGQPGAPDPGALTLPLPLLTWRRGVPAPGSTVHAGRALGRLAALLARHRPDVVNCHFVTSEAIYFLLLRPILRYRLVLSVHGSDVLRPKPWDGPYLARILSRADAITTVSHLTAARVRDLPGVEPDRLRVIPNGVDCDFWGAAAGGPDLASRSATVITVGRLHPVKGHDVLLRAFPSVVRRVPEARLVIVGDGGWRAHLEELARTLGVDESVEFTGRLDAEAVRARISQARAFVLPSRSEGLPLALLEAMAAGVPAVATSVGGVPEIVEPGTASLVEAENPAALADAIVRLLRHPECLGGLRERAVARARQFSFAASCAAYETLLLDVPPASPVSRAA